jgi:hypothetical protein
MKIYGYVLSEDTQNTSFKGNPETANLDKKSAGYVDTDTTSSDTTHTDVDLYKTQNYELTKDVQGTMADPAHNFPVTLTMAPPSGVTAPQIDVVLTNGATISGINDDSTGTWVNLGTLSGTVHDDSKIKLTGIPENSTVSVVERNDTADSYKVKAGTTAEGTNLLAEATVAAGANAAATTTQTFTEKQVAFLTNTLDAISPTGVVLRYGPFAAMLVGGIVLLFVATRRREERSDA